MNICLLMIQYRLLYNPYTVISTAGAISAGGTTGKQYLMIHWCWTFWEDFPTLRSEDNFTATAGQTTFSELLTMLVLLMYLSRRHYEE